MKNADGGKSQILISKYTVYKQWESFYSKICVSIYKDLIYYCFFVAWHKKQNNNDTILTNDALKESTFKKLSRNLI